MNWDVGMRKSEEEQQKVGSLKFGQAQQLMLPFAVFHFF